MEFLDLSHTFHTSRITECTDFYVKYLGAKITFTCDWYASVQLPGNAGQMLTVSFMDPAHSSLPDATVGAGTVNLMVTDVDAAHAELLAKGVAIVRELQDRPWGDRAFEIADPISNVLYIWSPREMTDEYKVAVQE